ncbi:MAG: hypothetical protein K6G55_05945 [Selenomonadaceae bacterium]|nr:hypothetical protein [Selenomonadaceae bacterium]
MLERVDRIERVARISRITNEHRFDSGRRRQDETGTFAAELARALNKKQEAPAIKKTELPEAYALELNSCGTHSLFYNSGLSLDVLLA